MNRSEVIAEAEARELRGALHDYYNTSSRYIDEMQSHDETYFGTYPDWVAQHLSARIGAAGVLAEIGCGGGASTDAIAARLPDWRCTGLDISAPAIAQASGRFGGPKLDFRVADCLDLPFHDGALDAVVSRDVVEHLPDVGRALAEMARVLKPGGVVVLRSPHHRSPLFCLKDLLQLRPSYPFTESWLENVPRFFALSADFVAKAASREPRFRYRRPDLTDTVAVGLDSDAVYEVCSLDLTTFFSNLGFTIHAVGATYGQSLGSRLVPRIAPYLASVGLVAQKPR
jgi:ubiquinone/menaquinone biosynthesis C-methylase UbiE